MSFLSTYIYIYISKKYISSRKFACAFYETNIQFYLIIFNYFMRPIIQVIKQVFKQLICLHIIPFVSPLWALASVGLRCESPPPINSFVRFDPSTYVRIVGEVFGLPLLLGPVYLCPHRGHRPVYLCPHGSPHTFDGIN